MAFLTIQIKVFIQSLHNNQPPPQGCGINYNYKENDMNNKTAIILILSAFTLGGFIGATYTNNDKSSVIHKTRSGAFIIQKNLKGEEQIYQVLELPSNVPSFVAPN